MCRQDYKETEIGCIPEDWQVVKLGKVIEEYVVKSLPVSYDKVASVGKGIVRPRSELYDKKINNIGLMAYVYPYSVVFGLGSKEISFGFNYDSDFWVSPAYKTFRVRLALMNYYYLYSVFNVYLGWWSKLFLVYGVRNGKQLDWQSFLQAYVPLPPLHEQKKIAEILSTVDDEIKTVDKEIEHAEEMKRGLLSKLLTEGIGHTEFKETEIGRIPKDWQVVKLGNMVKVRTKSKAKKVKDIAVITMEDIPAYGEGNIAKYRMIPEDKVKAPVYYESGDLLLAKITPSFENGKQAIVPNVPSGWGLATTEVYPLVVKDTEVLDVWFLFYYLRFGKVRKILELEMTGTAGQKRVKKESLLALLLPLPPLPEQKKIAEILSIVDEYIQTLREKKKHLEQVKKGLLNDLITGKRRVKVDA